MMNRQMQRNRRVTAGSIRRCVGIIAGRFTPFAVPEQRVALCQRLFAGRRMVNRQIQRYDRVAARRIDRRICINTALRTSRKP